MNGTERMIEVISGKGFTRAEAEKIISTMLKLKCMKFDRVGQLTVTHGALLDLPALRNALAY